MGRGSGRALGYRILGRGFDYLLHLRPAEWPILTLHVVTGTAVGAGIGGLWDPGHRGVIGAGVLAFVIGLNGGTLALNSAFDRDRGDIAYLKLPPAPPPGLAAFGVGLMVAGLLVATALPGAFLLGYLLCFLLSIGYSVPPMRWKGVAGLDWLVNFLGFGLLTPFAGWALAETDLTGPVALVLFSFAALFGALYPLTQLYQLEEDRARGDRTLATALGITRTFLLALPMAGLAFLGFAVAMILQGRAGDPAGWGALALAALAWILVLIPWWRQRERLASAGHQRLMKRAFLAWALTDLAVIGAFAR